MDNNCKARKTYVTTTKLDGRGCNVTSDLSQGLSNKPVLPDIPTKSDSQTSLEHEENNKDTRYAGHMVKSDTVQTTGAPLVNASSLQIQVQASAEYTNYDVEHIVTEYNKLKDEHSKLQTENKKLEKQIENVQVLNTSFVTQINDLRKEKSDCEKNEQECRKSHDSISRENKQLKNNFKTITEELQKLQEDLNNTKKDETDYVTKLAGVEAVISECIKVKEVALKAKEELTEEKRKLEEVCNTQKRIISTIEKSLSDRNTQIKALVDQKTKLEQDLQQTKSLSRTVATKLYDAEKTFKTEKVNLERAIEELKLRYQKLIDQTKLQEKDIKQYKQDIEELIHNREDLTQRLSEEWSKKVSADETNIENVSIKNRPMNIADYYNEMCTGEWLEVKDQLDKLCEEKYPDETAQYLCDIMLASEKFAHDRYEDIMQHLSKSLSQPIETLYAYHKSQAKIKQRSVAINISPKTMSNGQTTDYICQRSVGIDFTPCTFDKETDTDTLGTSTVEYLEDLVDTYTQGGTDNKGNSFKGTENDNPQGTITEAVTPQSETNSNGDGNSPNQGGDDNKMNSLEETDNAIQQNTGNGEISHQTGTNRSDDKSNTANSDESQNGENEEVNNPEGTEKDFRHDKVSDEISKEISPQSEANCSVNESEITIEDMPCMSNISVNSDGNQPIYQSISEREESEMEDFEWSHFEHAEECKPCDKHPKKALTDQLKNCVEDHFRSLADDAVLKDFVQDICQVMTDPTEALEYSSAANKLADQLPLLAGKAAYTDYIKACVTLAWKMVIQRPKMMYNTEGIGQKYDENSQELQWGGDDPQKPNTVVKYYVQPTLMHGQTLMSKGRVMTKKKM